MSEEITVADASCLIVLQNIGELSLLQKLFGEIFVTEEVGDGIRTRICRNRIKVRRGFSKYNPAECSRIDFRQRRSERRLLCVSKTRTQLLIIDEKKGRRIAQEMGVKIAGTLGVVLSAKKTRIA